MDDDPPVRIDVAELLDLSAPDTVRLCAAHFPGLTSIRRRPSPGVEARAHHPAKSQRAALRLALPSKVLVTTGGPGVGKTTVINSILKVLGAKGIEIALAAPTNRAVKRLSESTGRESKRRGNQGRPSTHCSFFE
jgi:exodeoxyribonuclease V alpha subunit